MAAGPVLQTSDERTIGRYLRLLEKRPVAGTAFDRVFDYYDQGGRLDQLIEKLQQPATSDQATSNQATSDQATSARQLLLGMVYLRNKDARRAIKQLQLAKKTRPTDPQIDDHIAQAWMLVSEFDQAAEAWQSAFERTTNLKASLSIVKRLTAVYEKLRQSEKSLAVLTKFEARFPGVPEIQDLLTNALLAAGRTDEAAEKLKQQLEKATGPDQRVKLKIKLADLMQSAGRMDEAIPAYQAILTQLNPESWQAEELDQKVQQLLAQQPDQTALEDFLTDRLRAAPSSLPKRLDLMMFLRRNDRHLESLQLANAASSSQLKSPELIRSIITDQLALKQYDQLEANFRRLERANELTINDVVRWGQIDLNRSDLDLRQRKAKAVETWNKLLVLNTTDVPNWQRIAKLAKQLENAGMPEFAIQNYAQAISSSKPSADVYIDYARLLVQQNNSPEAIVVLQQLVSGSSKSTSNLKRAIRVLKNFGEVDEAIPFATQLVEQDATSENRMILAELQLLNRDFKAADRQLQQVLSAATAIQQKATRQQIVDLLLQTDFVSQKFQQLQTADHLSDAKLLLLAQLAEVQGELTVALQTLQEVPQSSDLQISAKEMLARLQQKAGQLQDAEATLKTLIGLAPKRTIEYQETIQNLQLQMGRDEDAYKTAVALFRKSPKSASSVSRYVAFLKNSERRQEAISVLTDFLGQQDSSASMMVDLADLLGEQFQSDKAMDWLWKALENSTSDVLQRDIATRLVVLALRTNQTDTVLRRLKTTVGQNSSASEAHRTLLMVDAYRQARQLPDAVQQLQNLLRSQANNVAALTELVDLLSKLGRSREAIPYQFQLAKQKPSKEVFQRLTDLLQLETNVTDFEIELNQLSAVRGWPEVALQLVDSWLSQSRPEDAQMVLPSLENSSLADWKLQTRINYLTYAINGPQAALAETMKTILQPVSAATLLQISTIDRTQNLYSATSEAEAQVIAGQLAVLAASEQAAPEQATSEQPASISSLLKRWEIAKNQLSSDQPNPVGFAKYGIVLYRAQSLKPAELLDSAELLAALETKEGDTAALAIMLSIGTAQQSTSQPTTAWDSDSGKLVLELLHRLQKSQPNLLTQNIIQLTHSFMVDANLVQQARAIRQTIIPGTFMDDSDQFKNYWSMAEANTDLPFANRILDQWIKSSGNHGQVQLPENFGRSMAMFCSLGTAEQRSSLLNKFLNLKAVSTESARRSLSSGGDRSFEIRWKEKTSHRLFEEGRHVGSRNVVTVPENPMLEITDITFLVNLMHQLTDEQRQQLSTFATSLADQQSQHSSSVVHRLAAAHLLCLQSEFDKAILQLIKAAQAHPEIGRIRVLIAAYHAENGNPLSALNLLETVSSSDVFAYQQALWLKLRIGTSSGQLAVADQAARSLLGTRLTQNERRHLALVTKNRQLTVQVPPSKNAAPNARPMENLISRMQQLQDDGQIDKAIEVANSILLTGDSTTHTTTMANSARRSAVQLLAESNQLPTALNDVDRRLAQNSNSIDLLRLKLQILNGMNRVADAEKVRQQLKLLIPESPEEWIQMAKDLEDQRRFPEAVDLYLKAFQTKPSLLLADYYRYFKVFRRVDRLSDISDLLLQSNLKQLRDNYFVVSELIDILLSQPESTEVGRRSIASGFQLLSAAWQAFPSDRNYLLNNIQAKRLWESQIVVDFICDSLIPDSTQQAFARPWLGLDSKPVYVEGEGKLFALQRVLLYLNSNDANRRFLKQVIAGRKQFPEWQAGPYIEAAVRLKSGSTRNAMQDLFQLIDVTINGSSNSAAMPPAIAAVNAARILRGKNSALDGRLAELLKAAAFQTPANAGSFRRSQKSFADSTERLLAELQFSAGDLGGGRITVLRSMQLDLLNANQNLDAEAAWHRIKNVLSAVELLRSADLKLDAVNVSKQVGRNMLSASRGFQSNNFLDLACQRMWQQSAKTLQSADAADVLKYLKFQSKNQQDGQPVTWNLQLNSPSYTDQISWQNSQLISIIQRIQTQNSAEAKLITDHLVKADDDYLSATLCMLAIQSPSDDPIAYLNAVQRFTDRFCHEIKQGEPVSKNAVLAWCLVRPLRTSSAKEIPKLAISDKLIQQVLQLSLKATADRPDMKVWHYCILNEAAELLKSSGKKAEAADAWTEALDTLVPDLAKQPSTDRSPLKETRRLLLGP